LREEGTKKKEVREERTKVIDEGQSFLWSLISGCKDGYAGKVVKGGQIRVSTMMGWWRKRGAGAMN
jgi:hypothetical protein